MRFGWLTLAHSPSADADYAAIDDLLVEACRAEDVGFDGVWLTEHNFTGEAVYCDPIPFASALAARTSRVRIGFAVIQLALRHPIRLAVQLALLDNLSRGRLDVGVGRGSLYNEYEFVGYGLRSDDSRERSGARGPRERSGCAEPEPDISEGEVAARRAQRVEITK